MKSRTLKKNSIRRFAIKYNNPAVNGWCPICGDRTDPQIPLALFFEDSYTNVCDECGRQYAPELMELLNHFYQNTNKGEDCEAFKRQRELCKQMA